MKKIPLKDCFVPLILSQLLCARSLLLDRPRSLQGRGFIRSPCRLPTEISIVRPSQRVSGRWNLKDAVFNGLGKREKRERREGKNPTVGGGVWGVVCQIGRAHVRTP